MTEDFIESGPYEEVRRSPLPGMIRRTKEAVKTASETLGREIIWKLNVSNPSIPRLYTQLKLHKPGRKVRPITSNNNSPNEKLAQWLLSQFEAMPIKFETAAIKNTIEFVEKTKDLVLLEGEMQVSFDVESLYPNIPIDVTLQLLEHWLQSNQLEHEVVRELVRLTKICMDENWFRFNDKYYRQNFGCSMGSSLSPFLANLFVSHFETTLKKEGIFPRVWLRYVDDVYAIIKKHQLRSLLKRLNNTKYPTIKFTHEEEQDGKLNFLDLCVTRNGSKLEYDIYRKPSATDRYITSDSHHPFEHKIASFHSMLFRAVNVPLKEERFNTEIQRIKQIANH
ncbi:uncharacterized protein LOC129572021 [Sitodiplosis mosellana]|uniref:uncharacterized protein LOC129572021 n=1 Tax=Sitodiplosis mosellana TaxID=263140 RepID=UPI002444EE0D|nr:uncharacterized protein LOC129572021 [Sitodiplosis mosellana]